jgi:hypothetical protein
MLILIHAIGVVIVIVIVIGIVIVIVIVISPGRQEVPRTYMP